MGRVFIYNRHGGAIKKIEAQTYRASVGVGIADPLVSFIRKDEIEPFLHTTMPFVMYSDADDHPSYSGHVTPFLTHIKGMANLYLDDPMPFNSFEFGYHTQFGGLSIFYCMDGSEIITNIGVIITPYTKEGKRP